MQEQWHNNLKAKALRTVWSKRESVGRLVRVKAELKDDHSKQQLFRRRGANGT